ncbi:hypothetical protein L218DRAFT_768477 [Marasmius fiardii PR-910]|nr:hypothetical protein L218DRAFT_768477 [Marasmius fiardii PR-910]
MSASLPPRNFRQSHHRTFSTDPQSGIRLLNKYVVDNPGNHIASSADLSALNRALNDVNLTLNSYEDEAGRLERRLRQIEEECVRLTSTVKQVEGMIKLNIRKFPTEVLERVFELSVDWTQEALLLSHVCSRWRAVTFCLPVLWIKIWVRIDDYRTAGHLNLTRLALENSRSRPLDIDVTTSINRRDYPNPDFCAFIELLKHADRWQRASINLPTHRPTILPRFFPILEKLVIVNGFKTGIIDMRESCKPVVAPRLYDLDVCDRQWGRQLVTANLTRLSISDFVWLPALLQMLQNPALADVTVSGLLDLRGYTFDLIDDVVSTIASLKIDELHPLAPFFQHITVPSLKDLTMRNIPMLDAGSAMPEFTRCMMRSQPSLQTLKLDGFLVEDRQLLQALSTLPSLSQFSFTCPQYHPMPQNFHIFTEMFFYHAPHFLQNLTHLTFGFGRFTKCNGTLLTYLLTRLWHQTPRRLTSFSLGAYFDTIDEMTERSLLWLEKRGLDVFIDWLDEDDGDELGM